MITHVKEIENDDGNLMIGFIWVVPNREEETLDDAKKHLEAWVLQYTFGKTFTRYNQVEADAVSTVVTFNLNAYEGKDFES